MPGDGVTVGLPVRLEAAAAAPAVLGIPSAGERLQVLAGGGGDLSAPAVGEGKQAGAPVDWGVLIGFICTRKAGTYFTVLSDTGNISKTKSPV